jgi:hypothetical protein
MANSHDLDGRSGAKSALSRREAAARLGISTSSLRRLEDDLLLHPQMDEQGTYRFDPDEVAALEGRVPIQARGPRATPADERDAARAGRIAAKVFRLFARNRSLAEIVIVTKQPPARIRALYHEWVTSLEIGEMDRDVR